MQIHVACAIPNFYRAEHDPGQAQDDTLVKQGYKIKDGFCSDFDAPGLGIQVNTKRLDRLKASFDIWAGM
jgi:L-alanine-DL-glutamate epimerase-like enolase superfamily enzyme